MSLESFISDIDNNYKFYLFYLVPFAATTLPKENPFANTLPRISQQIPPEVNTVGVNTTNK